MANADEIEIGSGTSNIIHITIAGANDGDVIVLTDAGPYVNSKANSDDYTKLSKNITIKAANGITPVIKLEVPIQGRNGKSAKFIGIKFDCGSLQYDNLVHFNDAADNGLEFEDCEFYNSSKYIVKLSSDKKVETLKFKNCKFYNNASTRGIIIDGTGIIGHLELDGCEVSGFVKEFIHGYAGASHVGECIVNDCYFHNNSRSAVMFTASTVDGSQTCDELTVTNSTFANIDASGDYESVIDVRPYGSANTDAIKVIVDHCTFYNNITKNSDHANVRTCYLTDVTVSNCIFAHSEDYARRATYCTGGGNINNCLTYNYTAEGTKGHAYGATVNAASAVADPLFNDLANNKYTFTNNWTTMELSPAICAATDGSDLGDPRWHTMGTLPSTDFASEYDLLSPKALLSGRIELNENNHIKFKHNSETANGTAIWRLHVTGTCYVSAVAVREAESTSGCQLTLTAKDAEGNVVGSPLNAAASYNANDIQFPGSIYFSEEGDYSLVLTNSILNSGAILDKITLSYTGGAVQALPGTVEVADAWFSSNGTRADGKITFPGSTIQEGWVKWNVSFASAANYNVTLNVNSNNCKNYTIALVDENDANVVTPLTLNDCDTKGAPVALSMGAMEVPAGNYILKVTNATSYSDAELISVNFAYAGGAAIDLSKTTPASLLANADAILSDDWSIEAGKIVHEESKALTGWAKWNVDCANDGNYNVTVNISSDNGHLVRVEVFEDENDPAVYTLDEAEATKHHYGDLAIDLGNIALDNKEYVFKVSNTVSSSHVQIASIVITYQNGARATLPAAFDFADGILSAKAHITAGELWFNEIGDSNPVGQWAKWNVKVTTAGTFLFTLNTNSTNDQKYKITILDENDNEIDAFESKSYSSGAQAIKHYFNLGSGNYIVKLENTKSYSQGHIVSLVVTQPSLLVLDEAAEANTVIHNNYRNGNHDIQIIRTITAGMYNTICLPFDVSSSLLPQIFGSDVELKQMSSAELNGDELDLIFANATSIYRGTPYLIKTSSNVVNPIFTEVEIKEEEGQATSGTNADFIGKLIKTEIPAGEDYLFLGANNLLYFSDTNTPIKGMRAYFQVKGVPHPSQAIKHANIIANDQVVTSIDFTKGENNKVMKAIENGQLIIIRNGERFTVQGQRIQ